MSCHSDRRGLQRRKNPTITLAEGKTKEQREFPKHQLKSDSGIRTHYARLAKNKGILYIESNLFYNYFTTEKNKQAN